MADLLYSYGWGLVVSDALDWTAEQFGVSLVNGFTYRADISHQFLSSIPTNAILASGLLFNCVWDGDAARSDDVELWGLDSPLWGHALVLYHETFDAETSELIGYFDSYIGLPTSPNGDELTLIWPQGPLGIFTRGGSMGPTEGVRQELGAAAPGDPCSNALGLSRNVAY